MMQTNPRSDANPTDSSVSVTRLLWPDLVRVYAIASVVLLHCVAVPNTQFGQIPMQVWWQTNIYTAFVATCIPLFIMLSGALLLTQEPWDAKSFIRKRLTKVLLPLPVWTLVYAAWRKFMWGHDITLADVLGSFIAGAAKPIFPHLWFMFLILSLYLLVPVLRIYFLNSSRNNQLYFVGLWIAASVVKPVLQQRFGIELGYYLDPYFGYIGYFLVGATIYRFFPARMGRGVLTLCWTTVAFGYCVTLVGTYYVSTSVGKLDNYFYHHLSPTVIPMSLATFVLLRHIGTALTEQGDKPGRLLQAIAGLSTLSFGIYLVHALVIVLLESGVLGITMNPTMFAPIVAAPIMATLVFAASALVTALFRRFGPVRWLFP
jgi:surface polysaccharide O-acyltransferase-like enzyme